MSYNPYYNVYIKTDQLNKTTEYDLILHNVNSKSPFLKTDSFFFFGI